MTRVLSREAVLLPLTLAAAVLGALLTGAVVAASPTKAAALGGLAFVLAFPWVAPVTHLTLLVFITAIVPFDVQNSVGGGAVGLVFSDLLIIGGLVRAGIVLLREPLGRRQALAAVAIVLLLAVATVGFLRGISAGIEPSDVGFEFRCILGLGTLLIAIPLLNDDRARMRLLRALVGVGLALGVWGLVQFFGAVDFAESADAGLREGVDFTTSGRGQVQGGLFAFPLAVALSFAALMSGRIRTLAARIALTAVFALNVVSLLLTYERTFWVATVLALGVISVRAGRLQRVKAFLAAPAILIVLFAGLGTFAPNELTAARERLLSLSQYNDDNSVRYRVKESRVVVDQIQRHPFIGSGLGATAWWGRPWERIKPYSNNYAHNGYLWLAWKIGIPATALITALMIAAAAFRRPPRGGPLVGGVRNGAQAAMLILLLANITFPAFTTLGITPTMGVVLALCLMPPALTVAPAAATPSLAAGRRGRRRDQGGGALGPAPSPA